MGCETLLRTGRTDGVPGTAVAVQCGMRQLTYAALQDRIQAVVQRLDQADVPSKGIIALAVPSGVDWPVLLLALLTTSRVVLPLDRDPTIAERQLRAACPGWLLATAEARSAVLPPNVTGCIPVGVLTPPFSTYQAVWLYELTWQPPPPTDRYFPSDAAYLMPTSGTTGPYKTVIGSRAGLAHFIEWEIATLSLTGADRISQLTPPTFDPVLRDVLAPLSAGGRCCIPPDRMVLLDPPKLAAWLQAEQITVVHCVPTILRALTRGLTPDQFPALRHVLIAGEPLYATDIAPWLATIGERVTLWNVYGPTETTLAKFAYRITPADLQADRIPVGQPLPGCTAIVVDPADPSQPRPSGELGELLLRTRYRSHGYLDDSEQTAERFIANPFTHDPNDFVYRTGDLARIREDGLFELIGRVDDVVKIRGIRVALGIVEAALAALPNVRAAAVRSWRDAHNATSLIGYVVGDQSLNLSAIQRAVTDRLPAVAVPRTIIQLSELPTLPNGKVDRTLLPEPSPHCVSSPRTALERSVLCCWRQVLGDTVSIGVGDPLLTVGAQSIEVAQILGRLTERFGISLTLRELLRLETVSAMAANLADRFDKLSEAVWQQALTAAGIPDQPTQRRAALLAQLSDDELDRFLIAHRRLTAAISEALPPIEAGTPSSQAAPLTFAQERFWTLACRDTDAPHLHYVWAVELAGSVDLRRLETALTLLVDRHPVERIAILATDGGPLQAAQVLGPLKLTRIDLTNVPSDKRMSTACFAARDWARQPFQFGRDLLLRGLLVRLGKERWLFALAGHVLVSDGWSKTVLLRELATLYTALGQRRQVEPTTMLGILPLTFMDFASWERRQADAIADWQLPYWHQHLDKHTTGMTLPYDTAPTGQPNTAGGIITCTLDTTTTCAIRQLATQTSTYTITVLTAALLVALGGWSDTERVAVRMPFSNRPDPRLEKVIGSFTETFLLAHTLDRTKQFAALVQDIAVLLLEALDHPIPYQLLLDSLYPTLDPYDPAVFPVMFAPQPALTAGFQLPNVHVREIPIHLGTAINNLHLFTFEQSLTIIYTINYATTVFQRATIQQFAQQFYTTVHVATADPATTVGELTDLWAR